MPLFLLRFNIGRPFVFRVARLNHETRDPSPNLVFSSFYRVPLIRAVSANNEHRGGTRLPVIVVQGVRIMPACPSSNPLIRILDNFNFYSYLYSRWSSKNCIIIMQVILPSSFEKWRLNCYLLLVLRSQMITRNAANDAGGESVNCISAFEISSRKQRPCLAHLRPIDGSSKSPISEDAVTPARSYLGRSQAVAGESERSRKQADPRIM